MRKTVLGGLMLLLIFTGNSTTYAEVNDKDCGDFSSPQEVMEFWYTQGYSAVNDPHRLDGDGDGLACEVSQSDYQNFIAANEAVSSDEATDAANVVAEGEELPDTASNNFLIMLIGTCLAASGFGLLFRHKRLEA